MDKLTFLSTEYQFEKFDPQIIDSGNITNFELYIKKENQLILFRKKPHQWNPDELDSIKNNSLLNLYVKSSLQTEVKKFLQLKELAWSCDF